MKRWQRLLFSFFKVLLLAFAVMLISQHIRWTDLTAECKRTGAMTIISALVCMALALVVQAYKMNYASRVSGIASRFVTILGWEYEILFLEILLPVPDAEDAFRVFFWQKFGSGLSHTLSALLFSRLCGLIAIAALLPFTIIVLNAGHEHFPVSPWMGWLLLAFFLVLPYAVQKILPWMAGAIKKVSRIPIQLSGTLSEMAGSNLSLRDYIIGSSLGLLQLMFVAGGFYILISHAGLGISYPQVLAMTPLVIVAFVLPLSIQGLGLPEAAMTWMLVQMRIPTEAAAAIGMIHFFCYVVLIMTGAVVFMFSKSRISDLKSGARHKGDKQQTAATK